MAPVTFTTDKVQQFFDFMYPGFDFSSLTETQVEFLCTDERLKGFVIHEGIITVDPIWIGEHLNEEPKNIKTWLANQGKQGTVAQFKTSPSNVKANWYAIDAIEYVMENYTARGTSVQSIDSRMVDLLTAKVVELAADMGEDGEALVAALQAQAKAAYDADKADNG